ncbi:CDP-alcohol phosphatidyltransferase family protein [Luteimonas saliphila]|uniref:CDP-alcohol phosphatidyltransferase family protein n=1 Tax=Luteimonas saliphila TaxID=2804919 RepID=UPI00192D342B|nr:CDP-alcohol phosphatidyltransferase family protein [Luteimonas saliphila]
MEQQDPGTDASRRPIKARGNALVRRIASALASSPLTPNAISVLSIVFAGAAALLWLPPWGAWLCALGIQLRLLCNLFDGMVAVEGGKSTPTGALYNEVPDRIADSLLLVALGYAAGLPWAGWAAALFAALTAYVRTLGGALGLAQDFRGPMAKQHRMALMTLACLVTPFEAMFAGSRHVLVVVVLVIAAGSLLTCATRLRAIARQLEAAR